MELNTGHAAESGGGEGGRNACQHNVNAVPHYLCAEMVHEINHVLPLSPHYGWSTVLRSRSARGRLNYREWSGGTTGVLKARVPLLYISASFITAPLCAPHTCKAAFWWREGQRGKRMAGRWVEVVRDVGRGQWSGKIVSINLYLFRERWLGEYALSPVLYSQFLPFPPGSFPAFYCLTSVQLAGTTGG